MANQAKASAAPARALPRYQGTEIDVGGEKYVFPPLSFGAAKQLRDEIEAIEKGVDNATAMDTVCRVVHAALSRNYPEITIETVENELVDFGNWRDLYFAVLAISGFEKTSPGKAEAATP
jgi:hypothetical protein